MDSSRSKLDMSLDEIVKIGHSRQNRQVKRLDNNRRHSFPQRNGQQDGRPRNSFNNSNGFNKGFNNLNNNNRPSLTNRSRGTVQIGNLSTDVNEDDLVQLFNTIGDVERVEIMYDHGGHSRGVAKVVFRQLQDAMDAVEKYNNVRLDGQPMKMFLVQEIQTASQRSQFGQRRTEGNRFVRNFDSQRSNNRNNFNNGNYRQNNNNNRNFNNRPQRNGNSNNNFNNRRQTQNNNNNKPKEVNREDLDRDLEEFLASR